MITLLHRRPGRHRAPRTARPVTSRRALTTLATGGFLAAAVAANLATDRFGLIPVGFGLTATAGTVAAGLVLLLRDLVHDLAGRAAVYSCIAAGALLSAATAGTRLALASGVAFAVSELADLSVYRPLRRYSWTRAVLASNTVGALVDTTLFLSLAGYPIAAALPGQLWVKTATTLTAVVSVVVARAVLRHRVRPESP